MPVDVRPGGAAKVAMLLFASSAVTSMLNGVPVCCAMLPPPAAVTVKCDHAADDVERGTEPVAAGWLSWR